MSVEAFLDQYKIQPTFLPVTDPGEPARFYTYGAATIDFQSPPDEGRGIISLDIVTSRTHQQHRDMWEAARGQTIPQDAATPPDSTISYAGRKFLVGAEQVFQPGSIVSHPLLKSTVYISREEGTGADELPGFLLLRGALHVAGAVAILQSAKVAKLNAKPSRKGARPIQPQQCFVLTETILDHRSVPRRRVGRMQSLRNLAAGFIAQQQTNTEMA